MASATSPTANRWQAARCSWPAASSAAARDRIPFAQISWPAGITHARGDFPATCRRVVLPRAHGCAGNGNGRGPTPTAVHCTSPSTHRSQALLQTSAPSTPRSAAPAAPSTAAGCPSAACERPTTADGGSPWREGLHATGWARPGGGPRPCNDVSVGQPRSLNWHSRVGRWCAPGSSNRSVRGPSASRGGCVGRPRVGHVQ